MPSLPETSYMRLLPDGIAGTLARLELVARAKKQGAMSGRHTSPNKGFSVVFAEHRQYMPGDDIRDLDWRVFAKSDRYYIKQYIEETNLRATIVLDCSGSMKYRGDQAALVDGKKVSKFEYAQYLAAALAYLMIKQQDAVGLVTFDDQIRSYVKAASRPSQVRLVLGELDKSLQVSLYLALDQHRVLLQGGRKGSAPMSVPIADFTLLLATTDEYELLQPLRDRMRLVLRFEFYSDEELVQILRHRLRGLGWEFDGDILPLIAERSRGTPRLALRLASAAHRVARSEGSHSVSLRHFQKATLLEDLDPKGCGPTEQKYLQIVVEGPTRLNVIASRLGLPIRSVSEVVEPYLIRSGLVLKDDQGRRQLSAEGREHAAI